MKNCLSLFFICLVLNASAQKGLNEMIATEKSFAAYAVAHSTQEAFMMFIDTAAIVFDKGTPVNGYQLWKAKPVRHGILNWRPRFAEISSSGDFGYTCGPWTFQPQTSNDTIVANGYFFTIWQKRQGNDWKFIYDGGTDEGPMLTDTATIQITTAKTQGNAAAMIEAEENFTAAFAGDKEKAYKKFLSAHSVLCHNKSGLAVKPKEQQKLIASVADGVRCRFIGSSVALSGDLGYTYGNTFNKDKKEFYVHFWRREANGWKLAVEMLRY